MVRLLLAARPLLRKLARTRGQTLIEYSLIVTLVTITTLLMLTALGFDLNETFDHLENMIGLGTDEDVSTPAGDDDASPTIQ